MNTFPIKIRNKSGVAPGSIFVAVTGIDATVQGSEKQQFFNANPGKNSWQDAQSSVTLDALPTDGNGDPVLTLPFINSGIVFLSINAELTFNGTAMPDFSNPSNPSYKTLFDKFEISFLEKDGHPFINTTNVDFFCFPLSLQETLPNGGATDVRGFTKTRKQILDEFKKGFTGSEWPKLMEMDGDKVIRVVAPNKALVPPNKFDASFFQAYVDKVWEFYSWAGNTLTVDMSEIAEFNPGYKVLFTGRVVKDSNSPNNNKFVFSGLSSDGNALPDIVFEKPVGEQIKSSVFGCEDLFNAPNRMPRSVPAKNLGAAFNVGILALESGNLNLTPPTSTLAPNGWAGHKKNFYSQTLQVGSGATATEIVCYNLYSKILHNNAEGGEPGNGLVYGFAFDDVTGSDSTLAANDAINAIVTIQSLE